MREDRGADMAGTVRPPRRADAPAVTPLALPADARSGGCLRAAHPFVETDAAKARVVQRHQRALLDPSAPVSGVGVAHDLARVADRLQIAADDLVEQIGRAHV